MRLELLALTLLAAISASPASPQGAPSANSGAAASNSEAKFVTQARTILETYVADDRFSGAVLVAKDGRAVLRAAYGLANREHAIALTPEAIFRLGSLTKQFTAAAILQLAEQGKLSIDDPVSKHYTAAPASWSKVTIRHLLNHRSGIPSYTAIPGFFNADARLDRTPEEIIALTREKPLAFEPGAKFAYNNTGYILLGYIIEKRSGQTYADYLQTHIFTPLGMKHSGYDVSAAILPGRAAGYAVEQGVWTNADYLSMTLPYAAGSLYATLDDLLIWQEAFFSDKVISKSSREAMTTSSGDDYGFGIGIGDLGGHKSIRHNGGINGFSTDLSRYPADGLTVIVLANLGSAPSSRIADDLARLWFGLPAPAPPPALVPVDVRPEVLDRYVGVYELMTGFNITITRQGGLLMAQATGQSAFAMTATSTTEFHYQAAGIRMVFPEGAGPAQSFKLYQGAERTARRLEQQPN